MKQPSRFVYPYERLAGEMWELFSRVLTHVDREDLKEDIRGVMHRYEVADGRVAADE